MKLKGNSNNIYFHGTYGADDAVKQEKNNINLWQKIMRYCTFVAILYVCNILIA